MIKIFKYELPLKIGEVQKVYMGWNARLLSVNFQNMHLVFWAEANSQDSNLGNRKFVILHTGDELKYIVRNFVGTVQIVHSPGGYYVTHLYEIL